MESLLGFVGVSMVTLSLLFVVFSVRKSHAAETILKVVDRKGDKSNFTGRDDVAPAAADMLTFLNGKTYAGCSEYSVVVPDVFGAPKIVVVTDVAENDVDYKCVISYKDFSVPTNPKTRKLVIPAPDSSTANGICAVMESDARVVPAIPPDGAVGKGGNTLISEWETALGVTAGTFKFLSGGFVKVKR